MTERERDGADHRPPEDWPKRRDALAERLAAQRARLGPVGGKAAPPGGGGMTGMAEGLKLASEFIGGILAGAGLGYLLDRVAGTRPFGLVIFLLLGFAAGIVNVLRVAGKPTAPPAAAPDRQEEEKQSGQ